MMATNRPVQCLEAQLYYPAAAALGEGPVWAGGTLYWTDITGKAVYAKGDHAGSAIRYDLPFQVGAFALWTSERMVLATDCGFQCFDLRRRVFEQWINPEHGIEGNLFNDGKCDPAGRFIAGTLSRSGRQQAALYSLAADRTARRIYGPVTCSNGLAWSNDGNIFYYIDTPTRVVRAFCYDVEHGQVSGERVVIEIPTDHGKPDGMTIDQEGNLWIALWGGWGVECWNPTNGKPLARIEVPASQVTSCVFGGHEYQTLFITTARGGLDPGELRRQDKAGSVFCARPEARGRAAIAYAGNG